MYSESSITVASSSFTASVKLIPVGWQGDSLARQAHPLVRVYERVDHRVGTTLSVLACLTPTVGSVNAAAA